MAKHNELGMAGEAVAVDYLLNNGYEIVDRNWRSGHKEIDIIVPINLRNHFKENTLVNFYIYILI